MSLDFLGVLFCFVLFCRVEERGREIGRVGPILRDTENKQNHMQLLPVLFFYFLSPYLWFLRVQFVVPDTLCTCIFLPMWLPTQRKGIESKEGRIETEPPQELASVFASTTCPFHIVVCLSFSLVLTFSQRVSYHGDCALPVASN